MNMTLSVADIQLKEDGETVKLICYNGRPYEIPIKNITWFKVVKDKCFLDAVDTNGGKRRLICDFSKVRP